MKQFFSISLSISILFGFYQHVFGNEQYETLHTLMTMAEDNAVEVNQWTIYSRGHIEYVEGQTEMNMYFEQIIKDYPEFSWQQEEEKVDHHYVITGMKENEKIGIKEKLIITAYPYQGQYEINRSNEITGTAWTDEQQSYVTNEYSDLFSGSEMFYTIRGKALKDDIKLEEKANRLIESVDGKIIEGLSEREFISISAFSNNIESQTMTNGKDEMNLQLGMRTTEASSTIEVTIGTPIITTEY
ncbi:YwmB family TATA-box binding protein [Bacillus sp. PS06]|uniref:YwmB family TATA-box binding protein n=1 Tax=Bacillus sp. PS06 TaxID=2764176 RepID=UPI00177E1EF4|nr:YwmB family TATA-box binding protein [Bacillus sp. PS06]MBD8070833.1 YwmB family TATA-box binding protein [Bacillus sp. PS06]